MSNTNENVRNNTFPFSGNCIAQLPIKNRDYEREKLSKWCSPQGVFIFDEGYESLNSMFFYRCCWLKCIIFPTTMKNIFQYSCVPYVDTEYCYIRHEYSQYKYPCDYRNRGSNWKRETTKFIKRPLNVVLKSPFTNIDKCAFGDGDEDIFIFLEFDTEYDISHIKSRLTIYKQNEWKYINGFPTPNQCEVQKYNK